MFTVCASPQFERDQGNSDSVATGWLEEKEKEVERLDSQLERKKK